MCASLLHPPQTDTQSMNIPYPRSPRQRNFFLLILQTNTSLGGSESAVHMTMVWEINGAEWLCH